MNKIIYTNKNNFQFGMNGVWVDFDERKIYKNIYEMECNDEFCGFEFNK